MTADDPAPTVINTAAELDALPVGSVVGDMESEDEPTWWHNPDGMTWLGTDGSEQDSAWLVSDGQTFTVLFRPDAPQPATGHDALERAARAAFMAWAEVDATTGRERWADGRGVRAVIQDADDWRRVIRAALDAARAGEAERPEVVVICGSTRFRDEMTEANRDLTLAGAIVLAPGVFGHSGDAMTDEQKVALDALHFRKIDMADRVLVVAPGGYIGSSTSREVTYAKETGKPVQVREDFTAQRGGEAVDREVLAEDALERTLLAEAMRHGWLEGSDYGCLCGARVFYVAEQDRSMASHIARCQANLLAARGDAAPTVTAEQRDAVRNAIVATIKDGDAWSGDDMADAALTALGIGVRDV